MTRSTYFVQPCPTCGRMLQVRVQYLGKRLQCRHCHGEFDARDPESADDLSSSSGLSLLRRAGELLDSLDDFAT